MKIKVGLLSFGYRNFRYDIAQSYLEDTIKQLSNIDIELIYCNHVLVDEGDGLNNIDMLGSAGLDLLIFQIGTFTSGDIMMEIIERFKEIPLFIWGFKDPIVEDYKTIPLNSLTGFNMFTSFLYKTKKKFSYAYSEYGNSETWQKLMDTIKAIKVKKELSKAKFCVIGSRVPGFYLSMIDEINFRDKIGPKIEFYSIGSLLKDANNIDSVEVEKEMTKLYSKFKISAVLEMVEKNIRIELAILNYVVKNNVDAVSIKCWPEFQELYGCAVCSVLSRLNDKGIIASCEGDVAGLATMYIQYKLTNKVPFFTDLGTITKDGNMKAWHCGQGPSSLAEDPSKVEYTEHPTLGNGYGVSVQFKMKKSDITMCKLKEDFNGYKLFVAAGKTVDADRELTGTQTDIRFNLDINEILRVIVEEGIEHHYSIVHENISRELREFCKWMNIEIIECK